MSSPGDPYAPGPGGGGSGGREKLPRAERIRRGADIRELLRSGRRHSDSLFEVFASRAERPGRPRFGVVVPRHRHTIVERNRLRRRLREIGRREVLPRFTREGCDADLLVRSRPAAYEAPFPALREALLRLTERFCSDGSFSV